MEEKEMTLVPVTPKKKRTRRTPAEMKAAELNAAPKLEAIKATVVVEPAPVYIDPIEARKREIKEKWMAERAYKAQMVTGRFLFNECPGGELKFPYREFPKDELKHYTLKHDNIYTLPLGVAQHLNDRCSYPEYQHNLDGGKAVDAASMYITTKIHRTNFIPLDFTLDVGNHSGKSVAQVSYSNPMNNGQMLDSMGR